MGDFVLLLEGVLVVIVDILAGCGKSSLKGDAGAVCTEGCKCERVFPMIEYPETDS